VPGDRREGFGGLRCRLDIRRSVRVQGGRGRQDHEEGDQVGKPHPNKGVDAQAPYLRLHLFRRAAQWLVGGDSLYLFNFLVGLPEKEIGLIVVPRIATTVVTYSLLQWMLGSTVVRKAAI